MFLTFYVCTSLLTDSSIIGARHQGYGLPSSPSRRPALQRARILCVVKREVEALGCYFVNSWNLSGCLCSPSHRHIVTSSHRISGLSTLLRSGPSESSCDIFIPTLGRQSVSHYPRMSGFAAQPYSDERLRSN